ncbi:hypothetical protein BpHYR1_002643 [Brachionus plicatilis]|uniref:Uncharacterized protein n=1 Tax=Brachionus plicatilis TaxID=10195 RepID=A0A3M7QR68_BRAPC|nr:hypothetical protein BpHYR1_002643 [Brachionus plicatilis]
MYFGLRLNIVPVFLKDSTEINDIESTEKILYENKKYFGRIYFEEIDSIIGIIREYDPEYSLNLDTVMTETKQELN